MRTRCLLPTLYLVLAAACGGGTTDDFTTTPAGGAAMAPATPPAMAATDTRDLAAYPQAYRTMNLPALPGATVTSTGRQDTSLRDGLVIQLTTPMRVADTRDYYREALTARGWTEETGPGQAAQAMLPNLPLARLAFVQGALSYTVTATTTDGVTQVSINLIER